MSNIIKARRDMGNILSKYSHLTREELIPRVVMTGLKNYMSWWQRQDRSHMECRPHAFSWGRNLAFREEWDGQEFEF